jgi:polyisoprenoid-binding protein YceI
MKLIPSLVIALIALALQNPAQAADTYKIDVAHTTVGFSVSHMVVSKTTGRFNEFSGELTVADGKITGAKATIQVQSIDTAEKKRDDHLRNADFFDVEKFPTITFTSTKVEETAGQTILVGNFTIRDVTKEIRLPLTVRGPIKDPWGNTRLGLTTEIVINRKDYGLTWNKALEAGGLVVGEEVTLKIEAEAIKADAAK